MFGATAVPPVMTMAHVFAQGMRPKEHSDRENDDELMDVEYPVFFQGLISKPLFLTGQHVFLQSFH